ncbi:uncharacterized protein SRS1_13252 [Sporisorium reilianum f. sp. reilianum]|uniref:Uncharacterized protein n=1 Tax=Sporisorium reilianum f. sp. reilianum TaxID=72559 RepID=A0A2N8UBK9_9BASI|nr:uncharacterized protein SRS1_13252 [Sporisorium reilianum f. sp. reilianum]
MPATPEPAPAPTRNERKACWSHRDSYFSCLTQKGVVVPPGTDMKDGRGPIGKAAKEEQEKLEKEKKQTVEEARKQDPCLSQRQGYETNCARSWVDYFNKRRVLEERQKMMYQQAETDRSKR